MFSVSQLFEALQLPQSVAVAAGYVQGRGAGNVQQMASCRCNEVVNALQLTPWRRGGFA
jgi:hypothetical protein